MRAKKDLSISNFKEKKLLKIKKLITKAMLMEVYCSPKPGLVDRYNSGAHDDMDYRTFIKSTYALQNSFGKCLLAGFLHLGRISNIFPELKKIGLEGEKKMYEVTGGINTQKGLLFSMGIISAAIGYLDRKNIKPVAETLEPIIKLMTEGLVKNWFVNINDKNEFNLTAGERSYLKYGFTGIRGEVESGFSSVMRDSLPDLKAALKRGLNFNDAMLSALLVLMNKVNDTTIISRGGIESLEWMHKYADSVYEDFKMVNNIKRKKILKEMNKEFIDRNLSPGGCADLLAITVLFYILDCQ